METNSVQQEILLLKNTSLSKRLLFENDTSENGRNLTHAEQLEIACWNGWLDAMLPEILDTTATGKGLFLWQIMQAKSFLSIELCEYPQVLDVQFSINPYAIIATMSYE